MDVTKHCSAADGFRFKAHVQSVIGHITNLKIGDTTLKADMTVRDPMNASQADKTIDVVSVMNIFQWDLGITDPLRFSSQVSFNNKTVIYGMLLNGIEKTNVSITFNVYEYDYTNKTYFKSVNTNNQDLNGYIEVVGTQRSIAIASEPSQEVDEPRNYTFELGVIPNDVNQTVHFAVSSLDKLVRQWGIKVSS